MSRTEELLCDAQDRLRFAARLFDLRRTEAALRGWTHLARAYGAASEDLFDHVCAVGAHRPVPRRMVPKPDDPRLGRPMPDIGADDVVAFDEALVEPDRLALLEIAGTRFLLDRDALDSVKAGVAGLEDALASLWDAARADTAATYSSVA